MRTTTPNHHRIRSRFGHFEAPTALISRALAFACLALPYHLTYHRTPPRAPGTRAILGAALPSSPLCPFLLRAPCCILSLWYCLSDKAGYCLNILRITSFFFFFFSPRRAATEYWSPVLHTCVGPFSLVTTVCRIQYIERRHGSHNQYSIGTDGK